MSKQRGTMTCRWNRRGCKSSCVRPRRRAKLHRVEHRPCAIERLPSLLSARSRSGLPTKSLVHHSCDVEFRWPPRELGGKWRCYSRYTMLHASTHHITQPHYRQITKLMNGDKLQHPQRADIQVGNRHTETDARNDRQQGRWRQAVYQSQVEPFWIAIFLTATHCGQILTLPIRSTHMDCQELMRQWTLPFEFTNQVQFKALIPLCQCHRTANQVTREGIPKRVKTCKSKNLLIDCRRSVSKTIMMDQVRCWMKDEPSLWQASVSCQILKMSVDGCTLSQGASREKQAGLKGCKGSGPQKPKQMNTLIHSLQALSPSPSVQWLSMLCRVCHFIPLLSWRC